MTFQSSGDIPGMIVEVCDRCRTVIREYPGNTITAVLGSPLLCPECAAKNKEVDIA